MGVFSVFLLLAATLCLAQQMQPMNMCSQDSTAPACTLTFTPWMAPQNGPTSIYYDAILTEYLNIIDCRYCTITNVDHNPTPSGPFTEKATRSVLTVTRAGCMPETTAITRRDYRGYQNSEDFAPETAQAPTLAPRLEASNQDHMETNAEHVDPGSWQVMQAIYEYQKQIFSGMMSVTLITSGLDLNYLCQNLQNQAVKLSLANQGLYPDRVGNAVCYAEQFGVNFNGTTTQTLQQLALTASSFAFVFQSGSITTENTLALCQSLNLNSTLYRMLDIDSSGINNLICSEVANGTSTSTTSGSSSLISSATVAVSSGAVTFTSWTTNGSVVVTGTGVGFSWTGGAASATFAGSSWSVSGGNITGSAVGTAASGSWSSAWSANATVTTGSGQSPIGSISGSASAGANATASAAGSGASWSGSATWGVSSPTTSTAGLSDSVSVLGTGPVPTASWNWTSTAVANGSVIASGTAGATVTQSSIGSAAGTGSAGSWTSSGGNGSVVISYSGVAWTSWVVSSTPTVAIITGTAASIEWGTAAASATITGSGYAATFTIVLVTKTIFVTATAVAQSWSAYGANTAGTVIGTGTSGTWTIGTAFNTVANTATNTSIETGTFTGFGNISTTPPFTTRTVPPTVFGNHSTSAVTNDSGIPFIPASVTTVANITTLTNATATTITATATGFSNFTTSIVGTAVTSISGNASAVINATTLVATASSNVTTTFVGTVLQSSLASIGTSVLTVTNPENGSNVTLSINSTPLTPPKVSSYPAWTTSTTNERGR